MPFIDTYMLPARSTPTPVNPLKRCGPGRPGTSREDAAALAERARRRIALAAFREDQDLLARPVVRHQHAPFRVDGHVHRVGAFRQRGRVVELAAVRAHVHEVRAR